MSSSTASSPAGGHSRSRASRSSIASISSNSNSNSNSIEVSSSGTFSSNTSPASAAKAAAVTRQTSVARKRSSMNAARATPSKDSNNTTPSRRTDSISMARNGLSSSSSGGSLAEKAPATEPNSLMEDSAIANDELSRLSRDQLLALIVRERLEKEELDSRLSTLSAESATISEQHAGLLQAQALHETKLQESYASTERLERELSEHMDSLESTKEALREADKSSREALKRLREQTELYENEQAKWHEVEQSLLAQIKQLHDEQQALVANQHSRQLSSNSDKAESAQEAEYIPSQNLVLSPTPSHMVAASPTFQIPESTLEELQHLHTRVAELSSEHTDLSMEVHRLQSLLEDLQRVNGDLQEQNENYEVLLSERMLAGLGNFTAYDSGIGSSIDTSMPQDSSTTGGSRPPSSLDRLDEEDGSSSSDDDDADPVLFETSGNGDLSTGAVAAHMTPNRVRTAKKRQSMMGISGGGGSGGLDLEAELDRARQEEEEAARRKADEKARRKKERENAATARRKANQSTATMGDGEPLPDDLDGLKKEIKLLRQENKGLSTYVSKILEKIIGIEGFEKVLSVEREPKPTPGPTSTTAEMPPPTPAKTGSLLGNTITSRAAPVRTPSSATNAAGQSSTAPPLSPTGPSPAQIADNKKKNRFSMDWFASSLFKGSSAGTDGQNGTNSAPVTGGTSAPAPGLKPMRLTGGPPQRVPTAEEDDEDRKIRARLQSEMRLLGIETASSPGMQGNSPGSVRIGSSRSPGQRVSSGSGSYPTSPLPPGVPPKGTSSDNVTLHQRDSRPESDVTRTSGISEGSSGSPAAAAESVKIRGHRKRPSASFAPGAIPGQTSSSAASDTEPRARPTSVGLGLTYSIDSTSSSAWSVGSPSMNADNEGEDKRASVPSS